MKLPRPLKNELLFLEHMLDAVVAGTLLVCTHHRFH